MRSALPRARGTPFFFPLVRSDGVRKCGIVSRRPSSGSNLAVGRRGGSQDLAAFPADGKMCRGSRGARRQMHRMQRIFLPPRRVQSHSRFARATRRTRSAATCLRFFLLHGEHDVENYVRRRLDCPIVPTMIRDSFEKLATGLACHGNVFFFSSFGLSPSDRSI